MDCLRIYQPGLPPAFNPSKLSTSDKSTRMTITIKLFAVLKELAGTGEFELDVEGGLSGHEVLARISEKIPELSDHLKYVRLASPKKLQRPTST